MTKLFDLNLGDCAVVEKVATDQKLKIRLKTLGFEKGKRVRLLKKTFGRTVLVETETTLVGIGKKTADGIFVERATEGCVH